MLLAAISSVYCHIECLSGTVCCLCSKSFVLLLILGSDTDLDIVLLFYRKKIKYQKILAYEV